MRRRLGQLKGFYKLSFRERFPRGLQALQALRQRRDKASQERLVVRID